MAELDRRTGTRILTAVRIPCPVETVFNYATTPANWPEWHPASRAVSGAADHSLLVGEQVTEEFVAGGRKGSCVWQVTERKAPYLWTIAASAPQGQARISYRLTRHGEETDFERELIYSVFGIWFRILDFLLIGRRMSGESLTAVQHLKERLEKYPMHGTAYM